MIFEKKLTASPLKSADFQKIVSKLIAPRLRESGWKGSGLNYKRFHENSPLIDIIGFQVNKYGGTFCVEIGIHPQYLKERWKGEYDIKKLTHASLTIRKRLTPKNETDFWWDIGCDENCTIKILEDFWKVFTEKGMVYFNYFSKFPEPFISISVEQDKTNLPKDFEFYLPGITDVRLHWILAQTFDYLKDKRKAYLFAELAIKEIKGMQGSALREDLEEIMNKYAV